MASTWTSRTSAADNNWTSVTYGTPDGNPLFVAVANSGTGNRVMTSPDGITWASQTSADNNWTSVTYGTPDGNPLFVAVANSGTGNRVMTSPDGITWTIRTSAVDNAWRSVTYGTPNGNGLYVAVASTGTGNRVMTSSDGITWASQISAADNDWRGVTYGNGLFVAVGRTGTGNRVMTSSDGNNWTIQTTPGGSEWMSVVYGNGLFVAVAQTGAYKAMTSLNGTSWTIQEPPANVWLSVTYTDDIFVAVGTSGIGNRVMTNGTWSCYNIGTKILCLIDNEEKYIPIEDIKEGFLVKTYKRGYKKVELIGSKKCINSPSDEIIRTSCLYKIKDGDLTLSGGHFLLVDELPDGLTDSFYELNNTIEDKKCLLVCDSDLFEKVNEIFITTVYHLVLESDTDSDVSQYGIYAEGVLTETTTKRNFIGSFLN